MAISDEGSFVIVYCSASRADASPVDKPNNDSDKLPAESNGLSGFGKVKCDLIFEKRI